jgi:LmbE family N-acetylglucosaminyl deacetylase
LYHYIQDRFIKPDLVVDISVHWDLKESAIRAYKSQFYNPNSIEPESYLTSPEFLAFLKARSQEMGHMIGAKFGEGYTKTKAIGITDFFGLL